MPRRFIARRSSHHRKNSYRLRLERLESRLALAVAVWDGEAANNRWATADNWVGDVAPSPGDDLWFTGGALRKTNFNNFAAGTDFGSINFAAGGYTLLGNALELTGDITTLNAAGDNKLSMPITFTGARMITSTYAGTNLALEGTIALGGLLRVNGSGNTNLSGVNRGAAGIVKNGPGTLSQGGDNTYTGPTVVNAGMLSVSGFGKPLGSSAAGTTVNNGATLQTTHINDNMAEPLTLHGFGIAGDTLGTAHGALEIGPPAFTTWTGPITLGSDASIGVNHTGDLTVTTNPITLNGHTLTINGAGPTNLQSPIVDGTAAGSLAINTALLQGTAYGIVTSSAANTYTGTTLINSGVLNLTGGGTLASTDIQLAAAPGFPAFGVSNGFPIPGGVLRLDNTATLNNNRLPNTAEVTFDGGAFHYIGFNGAAASVETIGSMHFAAGQSYVRSEAGANAAATNRLTVGSLVRDAGATVDFSGPGLGTAKNRVLFTQAPTKVGSNGGILPYATVTAANQDFATYAGLGIGAYTGYETNLAAAAPSDIVLMTSSQTVGANKTVTGLLIRDAGANTTLTLASGVTLNVVRALGTTSTATSSNNIAIVDGGGGSAARLTFGAEGIIHRNAPTTIKTVIGGNTALTLSGVAPLIVEPPVGGNTYTGGTTLNSGSLTVNNNNTPLGNVDGPLNLHGGAFGASVFVGEFSIPNPLILDHANAHFTAISTISFTGPITLTGRNIVAVPGNVTLDFVGKVSGTGSMLVTAAINSGSGGGTLALSNAANDYSGGTTLANSGIFVPTLQLNANNVLGSGPLFLSGGNLTAGTPLTLAKPFRLASSTVTFGGASPITLAGAVNVIGINTLSRNFSGGPTVTLSGVISGTGAITKSGDHVLSFTANNTYTGSTLVTEGMLVVRGSQPNSPAGVVKSGSVLSRLSGTGTVGFIAAAKAGLVDPGAGNAFGQLTAAGANFSDSGILRLRVGQNTAATDFDSLLLGSGELVLGTSSPLQIDLAGLSSPRTAPGVVRYGVRLGVANVFSPVTTLNNPNGFAATPSYTPTAMNVAIANPPPRPAPGEAATVGYRNGDPSVPVLAAAAFSSGDFANIAGSQLLVRITRGEDATNRLLIGGSFKLQGSSVLLEGVVIGSLNESGGQGTTELRVTFNANATPAIAERLSRSIRFRSSGSSSTDDRVIEFSITD